MKRISVLVLLGLIFLCRYGMVWAEVIEIDFWQIWTGDRLYLVDEVISRFEALYPGIKVNAQLIGNSDLILRDKLVTAVAAGSPPDVAMIGRDLSVELGMYNGMLDLRPFLEKDGIYLEDIFYPTVIESLEDPYGRIEGIYFLPQLINAGNYLYYNKDIFDAAGISEQLVPRTFDELAEIGRKLTETDADGNLTRIGIDVFEHKMPSQYQAWVNAAGGSLFSEDRRTVLMGPNSVALETLDWMADFTNQINRGRVAIERLHTWDITRYIQGKAAMALGEDYHYFMIQAQAPEMEFGVASVPTKTGEPYQPELRLTWGYGIPARAKHPEAAWLFVKFLTMELEGGGWFVVQQGRPGAAIEFNIQDDFFQINPYVGVIGNNIMNAIPSREPAISGWTTIVSDMLRKVAFGETSSLNAMETARTQLQLRLDEFWQGLGL